MLPASPQHACCGFQTSRCSDIARCIHSYPSMSFALQQLAAEEQYAKLEKLLGFTIDEIRMKQKPVFKPVFFVDEL
jgi:hypothetical protein